jgi:hypothetical protein
MRRILACAVAVSLLTLSPGCSRKATEPAGTSSASLIPSDAAAVAVIRVKRIMESKLLEPIFKDEMVAEQVKQSPVDLRKIEQVTTVAVPRKGERKPWDGPFTVFAIVRFTEPTDGKGLISKLAPKGPFKFEDRTHQGKTYSFAPPDMFFWQADDKTLVLTEQEETLKAALSGGAAKGALAEKLQAAGDNADVVAVALIEPMRELIKKLPIPKGAAAKGMADVDTLPDQLKSVTLTVNLSGETLAKLALECVSADSGKKVHDGIKSGIDAGKLAVAFLAEGAKKKVPAGAPPAAKDAIDVVTRLVNGLLLTQSGDQVVLTAPKPEGLEKLVAGVPDLIRQWMMPGMMDMAPPKPKT